MNGYLLPLIVAAIIFTLGVVPALYYAEKRRDREDAQLWSEMFGPRRGKPYDQETEREAWERTGDGWHDHA